MTSRTFWGLVFVIWLSLFTVEIILTHPPLHVVLLTSLWSSVGEVAGLLAPGFLLWCLVRLFGVYKDLRQMRAMVLGGAVVSLLLILTAKSVTPP